MKNNLIGISGKIGSGKDTAAKIIQILANKPSTFENMDKITDEALNYAIWDVPKFKVKRFADKLKDIVCLLIGCTREELEDREFKEKELGEQWWVYGAHQQAYTGEILMGSVELIKLTPRKILQLLGTEAGRQIIHPDIWVNALFADWDGPMAEVENWVIPDMRFPNELDAVKSRGGVTLRIERFPREELVDEHASETALDDAEFDHIIINDGSLKDLVNKIINLNLM